jgi:beta-xylosidase
MQPVTWIDDWPVIGSDDDGDGTGEPRRAWRRPSVPRTNEVVPASSDDFRRGLGLQWQWQANPSSEWATTSTGTGLRLRSVPHPTNLWTAPHLLLQKFPALEFIAEAVMDGAELRQGERAGLLVFGEDYAWIGLERGAQELSIVVKSVAKAPEAASEASAWSETLRGSRVTLRVTVTSGARFRFATADGQRVRDAGPVFVAKPGRWVGAKVGVFAAAPSDARDKGAARVERFTVSARR